MERLLSRRDEVTTPQLLPWADRICRSRSTGYTFPGRAG